MFFQATERNYAPIGKRDRHVDRLDRTVLRIVQEIATICEFAGLPERQVEQGVAAGGGRAPEDAMPTAGGGHGAHQDDIADDDRLAGSATTIEKEVGRGAILDEVDRRLLQRDRLKLR